MNKRGSIKVFFIIIILIIALGGVGYWYFVIYTSTISFDSIGSLSPPQSTATISDYVGPVFFIIIGLFLGIILGLMIQKTRERKRILNEMNDHPKVELKRKKSDKVIKVSSINSFNN